MGDQASWNRSKALAAARGGARAGKPRWVRILVITEGCSMAAIIFKVPPHWGQCSMSISNTRLRKPSLAFALRGRRSPFKTAPGDFVSSWPQLMEAGAAGGGTSAWSAEGVLALTGTFGTMSGRSLALRPRRAKQATSLCLASEFLPLMGGAAHLGMEAKAVLVDTPPRGRRRFFCGNGLQAQYFLAKPGARARCGRCRPPLAGARARDPDRCRGGRSCPALRCFEEVQDEPDAQGRAVAVQNRSRQICERLTRSAE